MLRDGRPGAARIAHALASSAGPMRSIQCRVSAVAGLAMQRSLSNARPRRRALPCAAAASNVWQPSLGLPTQNVLAPITVAEGGEEVTFQYLREGTRQGPWGFRLNGGRIQSLVGASGWQELTDRGVMEVTAFEVAEEAAVAEQVPCPKACSADPLDTACWPTLTVRTYTITIEARSNLDNAVRRSQSSRVRVRNDVLGFNGAEVCPA